MSARVQDTMWRTPGELRHEPTEKRVRAMVGEDTVVDSTRAVLVWEPRRVVPSYAVPVEDVRAQLVPASPEQDPAAGSPDPGPPILHLGIPFAVHSFDGDALALDVPGARRDGVAFGLADPDLAGYVVLDFTGFDAWLEEDEPIVSHPRDPFHRVDVRRSSRPVRIELDGSVVAESTRPSVVFETNLPVRFYLPREDVHADLRPSEKRTRCAYKGEASYWSPDVDEHARPNLAWSYEEPLEDATALTGLVAFFDELVDVTLDRERRERPRTGISATILEEAGV
jgi:uncharacterized protein (DUF427 family)